MFKTAPKKDEMFKKMVKDIKKIVDQQCDKDEKEILKDMLNLTQKVNSKGFTLMTLALNACIHAALTKDEQRLINFITLYMQGMTIIQAPHDQSSKHAMFPALQNPNTVH